MMAYESLLCPYDKQYCGARLQDVLGFQTYVHNLVTLGSHKLFFDPGDRFDGLCPVPDYEKATCVRYQVWKKNHPNECR